MTNSIAVYNEKEYKKAFKEVLVILEYVPKTDYKKIPKDILETITLNADDTYDFQLDLDKDINEQKISEIAKAILENFYRDYWVSDVERNKILEEERDIREKLEEEKREKFNIDNLFVNKNNNNNEDVNLDLEKTKENTFLKKFISIIKNIFGV